MFRDITARASKRLRVLRRFLRRRAVTPLLLSPLRRSVRYFALGPRGERAAARYLVRNQYYIWDRNVRTKFGEIDIVAAKQRVLVFVEVKTRSARSAAIVSGAEAVDARKQRRLESLARKYMRDHRALMKFRRVRSYRFDIVEVVRAGRIGGWRVRQFRGAF